MKGYTSVALAALLGGCCAAEKGQLQNANPAYVAKVVEENKGLKEENKGLKEDNKKLQDKVTAYEKSPKAVVEKATVDPEFIKLTESFEPKIFEYAAKGDWANYNKTSQDYMKALKAYTIQKKAKQEQKP